MLLVPEINLTPQLEARVRARFAQALVVTMHSSLTPAERARNWLAVHEGRARILVGTRMAVFASFQKLSLIIVDEEHDPSYKAGEGMRFSARDVALKRAFDKMGLTARATTRILKVARTIADLDGEESILPKHLAEAIQYRNTERKLV